MPGDFDTVKERIDLVQLIGERVTLRRAGRAYKGLCPFHAEKTPSFTVDPERRTYKCFGCLPPGSLIKTGTGIRPIEAIRVGDEVWAGDGRLHRVLMTHEHWFTGDLIKLICAPFKVPLLLTPNHTLPILRPRSKRAVEVEAGSIRPQNYLLYPNVHRNGELLDWSSSPRWFGSRGKRPKPLPFRVETFEFAEWLGWYLAEGSVSQDRTVRFSLGGDELEVVGRLQQLTTELFGEKLRFERDDSRIEAWFCHALLARWLKHHCGHGAKNKRLPAFVWGWIPEQQWLLFEALLRGDGRFQAGGRIPLNGYPARGSWCLTLATPTLIDDVRDLLIRNGVVPSVRQHTQPDGRMSWAVTVSDDIEGRWAEAPRPSGPIPVRVRQVERVAYVGPVHNLTVEAEHTYVTLTATVNNCGEGGDAFTWLEKMDGLEPREALQVLAERAGVQLTRRAPEEREHETRLLAAQETAHFYFRQALRGTAAGKAAADYLAGRGIRPEMVERFGLGYAPDIRDGLLGYLRKKGFSDDEAVASGLVIAGERGLFDRFRDRLMVPIRDGRGRIIAFGGRAMSAGQAAKYMNSPQTELFDKSSTLYALDVAKPAMRRPREVRPGTPPMTEAVIVEGYFDAIASHQAGLDNVVASMGTALTEGQYRILDDLKIERAVVTFDGDAAGKASAEKRGRELNAIVHRHRQRAGRRGTLATSPGTTVHVAVLPEGDPDELARRDPDALRRILAVAEPVQAFVIRRAQERADLGSPEGRRRFVADVLPVLASEPDPVIREGYIGSVAGTTGLPHELVRQQVDAYVPPTVAGPRPYAQVGPQPGTTREPASAEPAVPSADGERTASMERYVVAQLIQYPEEAARLDLDPEALLDPDLRAIFELLRAGERPGPRYPAHLAAVVAALGALTPTPVDEEHAVRAIEMAARRLREENLRRRIGEKRQERARGAGDVAGLDDEIDRLTDELTRLMRSRERDTVLHEAVTEGDE